MKAMPLAVSCAVLGLGLGLAPSAAFAAQGLDDVGAALRQDPVYVDGDAEQAISDEAADDLREDIADGGEPIFVAVLPASTLEAYDGDPDRAARAVADAVSVSGTYAVVVGDSFRAGSTILPAGMAPAIATETFQSRGGDGVEAVLREFVDEVQAADGGVSNGGGSGRGDGDGGGGFGLGGVLLVAGAGAVGVYAWTRSRRRRAEREAEAREYEADRQLLEAEASVLAGDIVAMEADVAIHPDAQADFEAATSRFKAAQAALDQGDDGDGHRFDLVRVRRIIDEARYALARAKARIDGREPPPPPDELRQPGRHDEPALDLDEQGEPRYVGRDGFAGYGPFYGGGWFMGGNGLLTGLLLGSLLGGWGHPGPIIVDNGGGGGGDFGGGDFGGGDFGGGDFGGGDFGGGDFG
jgi:hypothetical protein